MGPSDLPDILLISADTMRRDCMAPYGKDLMPTVTRLLEEGVTFDKCFATAPWTGPSFASMFTGLWPRQHGFLANRPREGAPQTRSPLRADVRVLPEMLAQAGYHTTCAQANCGFLVPAFGIDRGYHEYAVWEKWWWRGSLKEEIGALRHAIRYEGIGRYARFTVHRFQERFRLCRLPQRLPMQDGETLLRVASRILERSPGEKPWFHWINFIDMHDPYCVPRRWQSPCDVPGGVRPVHLRPHLFKDEALRDEDKRYIRQRYDDSAPYVDHCIDRFLTRWRAMRRGRSLLTVFVSDHGEEFWDHGTDGTDPLYFGRGVGHGHTLFNELIHVPFVVHWPGLCASGRRVDRVVSVLDLAPTLVDILELEEDVAAMAGRSLAPCLVSSSRPEDDGRVVFADSICTGPERQVAVSATHKLVRCLESGETALYAWGDGDPAETTDLADRPDVETARKELAAALAAWDAQFGGTREAEPLSPEEERQIAARLSDLGYI